MDFAEFKKRVHRQFGLYLEGYKEPQLKRRIEDLMRKLHVTTYDDYLKLLISDSKQWQKFIDKVTINFTEFFRNPVIFQKLEKEIIPELIKKKGSLKVWSAACADGPEPYSVAIILKEQSPALHHRIEATDIDERALQAAKRGVYGPKAVQAVSPERLKRYFRYEGGFIHPERRNKVNGGLQAS